ncbi:HTH-type transcriptional repressor RspR [Paraburkholderia caffeinitolerans]|uniref:HTH-type transcriptional repressor RspR n=1 Tax=Paraburkholderia caffeinitolerans TaxID=1723730 RepID=A0A6J5GGI4_9BURK|nr:GntR family transcriptional regulator [Paraburkholderia caffeinitolerans]CAB3798368.1 HTH-type transcriptional repressor RspR [Paraburkholderia caffeinitolerans]
MASTTRSARSARAGEPPHVAHIDEAIGKSTGPVPGESADDVEALVYASINSALLQGKLAPGQQLVERELAAAFGCTRGALRKVLARLGFEGKLVLEPNRGAFVPSPSEEDIRATYRARQVVEAGVAVTLCGALDAGMRRTLAEHVRSEKKALREGRVDEAVRLAGQFHLILTELAGGAALVTALAQLVARTELYKALFDPSKATSCAPDEHEQIIAALEAGDQAAALATLREHLAEIEERVVRQARARGGRDLKAVFADIAT